MGKNWKKDYKVLELFQRCSPIGGEVNRRATQIRPKAVESGIFSHFPNFDKCRSQVAGDVISGVVVDYVGMDGRATFCESGLNSGRIILLFGRPDPFYSLILSSI